MDDEAAYMALATANNQGELAPLEIGIHALGATKKDSKKGGSRSNYGKQIGKTGQYVGQVCAAADVATQSKVDFQLLKDHAQHLYTLHSLPNTLWPQAVEILLDKKWTVKDTESAVGNANTYLLEPIEGLEKLITSFPDSQTARSLRWPGFFVPARSGSNRGSRV